MAKILEAAKERKAMAEKMSQATILDQGGPGAVATLEGQYDAGEGLAKASEGHS